MTRRLLVGRWQGPAAPRYTSLVCLLIDFLTRFDERCKFTVGLGSGGSPGTASRGVDEHR